MKLSLDGHKNHVHHHANIPVWSSQATDRQWYAEAFQTPALSTQLHTCRTWCVRDVCPEALAPTSALYRYMAIITQSIKRDQM